MTDQLRQAAQAVIKAWDNDGSTQTMEDLRTALAQQAEPVAWMFQHDETGRMNYVSNDGMNTPELFLKGNLRYALVCPLYTTPPQRPWVGLTPEEVLDLFDINNVYGSKWVEFARTVESKLKEKNT